MSILNVRLIDANELRRNMYHKAFETDTDMQKWDSGCWIRYKMFDQVLESAPTIIDVGTDELQKALLDDKTKRWVVYGDDGEKVEYRRVDRPKGSWIKNEGKVGWHCSECKADNNYAYSWNSDTGKDEFQDKYCPNCGAEMRKE